jgi:hypothetical protein
MGNFVPEATGDRSERVSALITEVKSTPVAPRWFFAALMAFVAWSCLSGAYLLAQVHYWVPLAIAVLILEPLGVAAAFAVVFVIAPDSVVADWFAFFFTRAKAALLLVAAAVSLGFISLLVLLAWEYAGNSS